MSRRALLAAASALALTGAVAGCGSDHDTATNSGSGAMDGMAGMDHSAASSSPGSAAMADMAVLGSTTQDDVKVSVEAMAPETFFVADGAKQVKHAPGGTDSVHLMVTLADDESGIRLPDASVTAQLTGPDGTSTFDGPLYPMIGRGMGMHYGENVTLKAPGTYSLMLVAGPPRIGRHLDAQDAWTKTVRVPLKLRWDGKQATPAS